MFGSRLSYLLASCIKVALLNPVVSSLVCGIIEIVEYRSSDLVGGFKFIPVDLIRRPSVA